MRKENQLLMEDSPSYKILNFGVRSLSDSELLLLILNIGAEGYSIVSELLKCSDLSLKNICSMGIKELMGCGLTMNQAKKISAVSEFARRSLVEGPKNGCKISSSKDAFKYIYSYLSDRQVEHFYAVYLSCQSIVLGISQIGVGGINAVSVDRRVIFKNALEYKTCTGIILFHNHPSESLTPSEADKSLTKRMVEAGKVMDIKIIDHLIIGKNEYLSFADEGLLF